jgi:hypothetical protein
MRVVSRFYGINSGAPAVVSGVAGLYIFAAPVALGTGSPVPNGQNLSDLVMPFQNLNTPGSGRLNGQAFQVKAVGEAVILVGGGTINLALQSNLFTALFTPNPGGADTNPKLYTDVGGQTSISVDSQTLAELPSAQSVSVGSIPWSIQADFSGDGKSTVEGIPTRGNDSDFIGVTGVEQIGSGLLGGMFTIVIAGVKYSGTLVPITDWDAFKSPSL